MNVRNATRAILVGLRTRIRRGSLAMRLPLALLLAITSLANVGLSASAAVPSVQFNLSPNAKFLPCFAATPTTAPTANVTVTRGSLNDTLEITLNNFKPNLAFDLFTVQRSSLLANGAADPSFKNFGLAWYQSDIETDSAGHADVTIKTILLDQIFGFDPDVSLTPTNTFHVGFWFNNPQDAVACGFNAAAPTPFNGEHTAGPLAMISVPNAGTGLGPLSTAISASASTPTSPGASAATSNPQFNLSPNAKFLPCFAATPTTAPTANVTVTRGSLNDTLEITLNNFKPNLAFDLFTVQRSSLLANGAADPSFTNFGLAWYQSDIETDSAGHADVTIKTILLDQIFGFDPDVSLTPTNTFHVGFWFNNPQDAVACGFNAAAPTPFNGEHTAGPLAMISVPNAGTGLGPLATESATLTATPAQVPFGQNSTTLTFSIGDGSPGTLCVAGNGGTEAPFAGGASGTATASFINSGAYVFTLHAGATCAGNALATTTVTKLNPKGTTGPAIVAAPATFSFATSTTQLVRTSTISFDTGDGSVGQVMLSVNGSTPVLFTASQFGSVAAPWIFSGAYTFTLVKNGATVDTATVQTTAQISSPNGTTSGGPSPNVTTTVGHPVLLTFDTGTAQPAALCTQFGGLVSFSQNGAGFSNSVDTAGAIIYSLHVGTCAGALATPGTVTVTAS